MHTSTSLNKEYASCVQICKEGHHGQKKKLYEKKKKIKCLFLFFCPKCKLMIFINIYLYTTPPCLPPPPHVLPRPLSYCKHSNSQTQNKIFLNLVVSHSKLLKYQLNQIRSVHSKREKK